MGRKPATFDLQAPGYTPNRLLNKAAEFLGTRNDAELARALGCHQAQLSRMRERKERISERMLVQVMDRTNWTIRQVRAWAGMPAQVGSAVQKPRRKQPTLKLTDAQVREVRDSKQPVSLTAELYDISERYVQLIQSGKARREVGMVRA